MPSGHPCSGWSASPPTASRSATPSGLRPSQTARTCWTATQRRRLRIPRSIGRSSAGVEGPFGTRLNIHYVPLLRLRFSSAVFSYDHFPTTYISREKGGGGRARALDFAEEFTSKLKYAPVDYAVRFSGLGHLGAHRVTFCTQ